MMDRPQRWKSFQLDYDALVNTPENECCICISERSMNMVLSIVDAFHWATRYYSEIGTPIDRDLIDRWAAKLEGEIVTGLNGCGCGSGGRYTRITAGGVFEISIDGGLTWTPAPTLDPRNNSTQFPPLPLEEGEVTRCAAANNIVDALTVEVAELVNQRTLESSLVALVAVLTAAAAVWLSFGALGPLVVSLAAGALGVNAAALAAAFTSDVWEDLQCAIYCHVGDDGTVTTDDIPAILEQFALTNAGTSVQIITGYFNLYGSVGLTNMGRTGTATGTGCDDCACDECDAYEDGEPGNLSVTFQFFPGPAAIVPSGWSFEGDYNLASHQLFIGACGDAQGVLIAPEDICIQRIAGSYDTAMGATDKAVLTTGGDVSPDQNPSFDYILPMGRETDRITIESNGVGGDCIALNSVTIWYREL